MLLRLLWRRRFTFDDVSCVTFDVIFPDILLVHFVVGVELVAVGLPRVLLQPMHGDEGSVAVGTLVRPLAGVLAEVTHERVLVPELQWASRTLELFLRFVNLETSQRPLKTSRNVKKGLKPI